MLDTFPVENVIRVVPVWVSLFRVVDDVVRGVDHTDREVGVADRPVTGGTVEWHEPPS